MTGEIGNGDRYKASGYVNVPVGDNAAFRFAGSQQWFKGYWHNELDDKQVGGTDETVLRGSFRGEVGPVEWMFRADHSKLSGDGATNIDFDRRSVSNGQWAAFSGLLGAPDTDLKDKHMNQFLTADVDDKQWGVNSTLSWDVGGGSTVRLINDYPRLGQRAAGRRRSLHAHADRVTHGPVRFEGQNHELQFISPAEQWLDGRLDLVAGLYYFHEKYEQGELLHMNAQFCNKLVPVTGPPPASLPLRTLCNNFRAATGGTNATVQDVDQTSTVTPPMRRRISTSPISSSRRLAAASPRTRRKGNTTRRRTRS